MAGRIRIMASVTTEDPEVIARASETFARAATGFVLDGVEAFISIRQDDDDE